MFERILNVLWCLLGLATMVNAWSMGLTGKFGPESGLFPFICGAIITACGVGLIFKGSKEAAPNPAWPRAAALGRILGVVAGLLAMAATLPYLGFAVASSLTTFVLLPCPTGKPHGKGSAVYDDGSKYDGGWCAGSRHGQGVSCGVWCVVCDVWCVVCDV
jgi:hypothetical protein